MTPVSESTTTGPPRVVVVDSSGILLWCRRHPYSSSPNDDRCLNKKMEYQGWERRTWIPWSHITTRQTWDVTQETDSSTRPLNLNSRSDPRSRGQDRGSSLSHRKGVSVFPWTYSDGTLTWSCRVKKRRTVDVDTFFVNTTWTSSYSVLLWYVFQLLWRHWSTSALFGTRVIFVLCTRTDLVWKFYPFL